MTTWPSSLPPPLRTDYRVEWTDPVLRLQPEVGPPLVRLRARLRRRLFRVSFFLNATQRQTFLDFWSVTTSYGTVPFTWTEPQSGVQTTVVFDSAPVMVEVFGPYSKFSTVFREV